MRERLDDAAIEGRLAELSSWTRVDDTIRKEYQCAGFADAIAFVVRIGFLAEAADHHPDIEIRWRNVTIALSTHDAGGLTTLDFDLAARIDEVGFVIWIVVLVLVIALAIAVVIAVAKDPGPSPTEVALAFEHAWDLLDFDVVFRLSGPELHDGLNKAAFVAAKRAAYASGTGFGHLVAEAMAESEVHQGDTAAVITRLTLRDGAVVHNEVRLVRRSRAWSVVAYELRPASAA